MAALDRSAPKPLRGCLKTSRAQVEQGARGRKTGVYTEQYMRILSL
jgi:hypothetical protein